MSKTYKIRWADWTWNPVTGCTAVSPACDHCYARKLAKRFAGRFGYPVDDSFRVTVHYDRFQLDRELRHLAKRQYVFVVSMGDMFHKDVPQKVITTLFNVFDIYSKHTYMILTKRPERMLETVTEANRELEAKGVQTPLPNVWLGVTAENQEWADKRIPVLLETPAILRFVSCEPLLEEIDLHDALWGYPERAHHGQVVTYEMAMDAGLPDLEGTRLSEETWEPTCPRLDWVICGGENGAHARWMEPDWVRVLRDECKAAGVPFFMKGMGQNGILPPDLRNIEQHPGRPESLVAQASLL